MQTFLPYDDIEKSVACLDYRRLGKQRVEALQILKALKDPSYGWQNHPATKMWRGYEDALKYYMNACIEEWIRRGYKNSMKLEPVSYPFLYPLWFGDEEVHASHRSNLLRKDSTFYGRYCWAEPNNLPYIWPVN
jgi:hypothetical protein